MTERVFAPYGRWDETDLIQSVIWIEYKLHWISVLYRPDFSNQCVNLKVDLLAWHVYHQLRRRYLGQKPLYDLSKGNKRLIQTLRFWIAHLRLVKEEIPQQMPLYYCEQGGWNKDSAVLVTETFEQFDLNFNGESR